MDTIDLPLVKPNETIETGLSRMRGMASRAVVLERTVDVDYRLLMNHEVLAAWAAGAHAFSDISGGAPVVRHTAAAPSMIETALDKAAARFGFVTSDVQTNRIKIATRHEGFRAEIASAPLVCRCTGAQKHLVKDGRPKTGDPCPMDGKTLDCY